MPRKDKFNFRKVFGESLMIILSVLFALFINEWRTNYNENRKTDKLLDNIVQEIQTNQVLTKDLVIYHETVYNRIEEIVENDSMEIILFTNNLFNFGVIAPNGIIQDSYKSIAWEVAIKEGISSRIDFDQSKNLFEVYDQQKIVDQTQTSIVNFLNERLTQRKEHADETLALLYSLFLELKGQEMYLLKEYKQALEVLGSN